MRHRGDQKINSLEEIQSRVSASRYATSRYKYEYNTYGFVDYHIRLERARICATPVVIVSFNRVNSGHTFTAIDTAT
jgi:hypothetical protein